MCPPSSIAPVAGSTACNKCSEGFTTPNTTRTACSVCLPGRAGPTCQKCRPGTWSAGGNASSLVQCTSCPNGTHSMLAGSTSDKDCKPITDKSWQSINITVSVNSTDSCNTTAQKQLADMILLEIASRTAPQHTSATQMANATCTATSVRRGAVLKAVGSTYSFFVSTVGLLGSFSDLQTQLQWTLGTTYTLGATFQTVPVVILPPGSCKDNPGADVIPNAVWNCSVTQNGEWCQAMGCADTFVPSSGLLTAQCVDGKFVKKQGECVVNRACKGNPAADIFPNAVWNCNVTQDGEWCQAVRCADNFLPSSGPLAAQCMGGKFVKRQGDCFSYSMFPCLSSIRPCAQVPRSTGQCASDGIRYGCVCILGATWNPTTQECACDAGTEFNATANACVAINPCASNPCAGKPGSSGTCTPEPMPSTGHSCSCTAGYSWADGACQDTSGCAGNPCRATENSDGTCRDVRAPGTGYVCGCNNGYAWADGWCQDVDGCIGSPCTGKALVDGNCYDTPASGLDYWKSPFICGCVEGYSWIDGKCQDTPACEYNDCDSGNGNGTCFDNPAPKTGYTCGCKPGTAWTDDAGSGFGGCTRCATNPCAPAKMPRLSGTCYERPELASVFACGCATGAWWDGTACSPADGTCVQVFAGLTGLNGYKGDGGPATAALFWKPSGLAVDAAGNVFIADAWNAVIRKVSATGTVTTLVTREQMVSGYLEPAHVLVVPGGDVYFTTGTNHVYRLSNAGVLSNISVADPDIAFWGLAQHASMIYVVGTYYGVKNGAIYSFPSDLSGYTSIAPVAPRDQPYNPRGLTFNGAGGDAFVVAYPHVLEWAGTGAPDTFSVWNTGSDTAANDVLATSAKLSAMAVASDAAGNLLISDVKYERDSITFDIVPVHCVVWHMKASNGKLWLVAGKVGTCGSAIDPNNAASTQIGPPRGMAFDPSGEWAYIADADNERVLKVKLTCGRG
uniref:EGF-like domain-containing protein n=1 Tax=Tetradesmus obliquus TaxID=3088 RepID=A0A383V4J0_TETOB|eukprot:jgi/Sobl393_1/10059/SZX59702.1